MANEVMIDITANFKDNAYDKVDQLKRKLEELENHRNKDLNVSFENSRALSNLNNVQSACSRIESRMKKLENSQVGITFSVNITDAERNINKINQKLSGITNRTANILVTAQGVERLTPSSLQTLVGGRQVTTPSFFRNTNMVSNSTTSSYSAIQRQMNRAAVIADEKSKIDSKKEMTSDVIKGTTTLVGGLIGAAASTVLTPVGGALVAGLTSIIGDVAGNGIAEFAYDSVKTPQEILDQYISKNFGSISLSQSALNSVATSMLADNKVQTNPNRGSIEQGKIMQGNVNTSYSEIKENEERIGLKQNNGVEVSDNEYASYLKEAQDYASSAIEVITKQWYNERNSVIALLGNNHPSVEQTDQKYSKILNGDSATGEVGLINIQKDLNEYIKQAIGDNKFTLDEMLGVSGYIEKIDGYTQGASPEQSGSEKELFDFLSKKGMLSNDSFIDVISEMQGISDADVKTYAEQRLQVEKNIPINDDGKTIKQADAAFYQKSGDSMAGAIDTGINLFDEYSKDKFTSEREDQEKVSGKAREKTEKYLYSLDDRNLGDGRGITRQMREWASGNSLQNDLGFGNVDTAYQEMAKHVYDTMSNKQGQLEKTALETVNSGGNANKQYQALESIYKFGALSGDPVATQKYLGAFMTSTPRLTQLMHQQIDNPFIVGSLNQDMVETFKLFEKQKQSAPQTKLGTSILPSFDNFSLNRFESSGDQTDSNSLDISSATTNLQQNSPSGTILSGSIQSSLSGFPESRSNMPGDELASGTLEMLKESLSAGNIDFKSLGLGESLMGALGEGLSSSEIDFGNLDLGKDLMSKIGESLTSSEIDFTQLDFGKNLMSAIAEGLTESEIDFEGLGLGESLISQIGEGLTSTEIDFSELGFGENLMAAIVEGLTDTEIDFEGLGLGESLMSQIGEGLTNTEIDFSELGFGENLMSALVAGLTESDIDFEGLGLGESLMSLIGEGLTDTEIDFSEMGFGENLMSALVAGLTESEIDFEGLGIGETIMSMLGESLSAIDFSESGIGESMMASIANAFSSVSFEEMDLGGLGEGLSASIASSLGELDLSGITEQFSILSENPIQLEAVDNASPAIQQVQGAVEGLIAMTPNVNIGANDEASGTIASVSGALTALNGKTATVTVIAVASGESHATGTLGAAGGLSLINDEATADPRELIERNGRYMMYEGKNVLTVLEPNDRVYTASQTKTIMANMGVPYYAKGKNNNIISSGGGIIPTSGSGSSSSGVAVGGVNLSINVSGGDADVIDQIKKRGEEVAEYIAGTISSRLSDAYANTPVATE